MGKWTEENTYQFVKLYREKECLWKKNSVHYRNKNSRRAAEEDIVRRMGVEGFGVIECKKKIKIIRTTYNQEVFKVKKSKKSGGKPEDIYVPGIKWYKLMHEIMGNYTSDNQGENMEITVDASLYESKELRVEDHQQLHQADELSPRSQHRPVKPLTRTSSRAETRTTKKPRLQMFTDVVKQVKQIQESLANSEYLDENEAFGKLVTASLNKLSPTNALMAQGDIHKILQQYRLSSLTQNSAINFATNEDIKY